jgi:hypothetical protein
MSTVEPVCWRGNTHKRGKNLRLDTTSKPETGRRKSRMLERRKIEGKKEREVVDGWRGPFREEEGREMKWVASGHNEPHRRLLGITRESVQSQNRCRDNRVALVMIQVWVV